MTTAIQTPTTDQEAIELLADQILGDQEGFDSSVGRETAAVSLSLAVKGNQAGTHGWITYTDREEPNKTYYAATRITRSQGEFAGGFPGLSQVLPPERVAGKSGTFHAGGFGPAGLLQIWIDGVPVFGVRVPVAGAGHGYWRVDGEVRFTVLQ